MSIAESITTQDLRLRRFLEVPISFGLRKRAKARQSGETDELIWKTVRILRNPLARRALAAEFPPVALAHALAVSLDVTHLLHHTSVEHLSFGGEAQPGLVFPAVLTAPDDPASQGARIVEVRDGQFQHGAGLEVLTGAKADAAKSDILHTAHGWVVRRVVPVADR